MTVATRRMAAERPDEVALSDGVVALDWRDVDEALNRIANAVLESKLAPRHRVGVVAANSAETALTHVGGLLAGSSVVPINSHLTAHELAYILDDGDVGLVFADTRTAPAVLEAAEKVGEVKIVAWGCQDRRVIPFDRWLAGASAAPPPEDLRPRPQLVYTSGTTGRPKGVELPPGSFAGGQTIADHVQALATHSPFAEFGTHLVIGPMYHTGPMTGVRLLAAGVPLRIMRRFDADELLRTIESERVESAVMVPTHFQRLLALAEDVRAKHDVSSLRYVLHTGAACPVPVKRAMLEWWGPVLYEVYGATEVGPTCGIGPHAWAKHPGSVGRPIPPLEVVVLNDDGGEVPANTEGVLYFRDPSGRGLRYVGRAAADSSATPDDDGAAVFTLGEIGYVDEDGYVFVTDRIADMVVSGGVNIYPAESEQVLDDHDAVADVTCIGVPHEDMGEELIALVVPSDEVAVEPAVLIDWCRDRLAPYKCPRRLEFVESLPRTEMGKINKRKLRDAYLADELAVRQRR